MGAYRIVQGPMPGMLRRIVEMHDSYYGKRWGFGPEFTEKNVAELTELLGAFDPKRDGIWTAHVNGCIEGTVAIDGSGAETQGAHLRWFLVSEALRGQGAGSRLLQEALTFCRARGFARVYLWTFAGLDDARRLYERSGFVLTEQHAGMRWGTEVLEQRLECRLSETT